MSERERNFAPTSRTNTPTDSQTMNDSIELTITNGKPTTTSVAIAERFGKRHDNVLRDIENLECTEEFSALNFEGCAYKGGNGKLSPMYSVTKDGFVFLAMGFTDLANLAAACNTRLAQRLEYAESSARTVQKGASHV